MTKNLALADGGFGPTSAGGGADPRRAG